MVVAEPKSGALVSLFSIPLLYRIKTVIRLFSTGCKEFLQGDLGESGGWGGGRGRIDGVWNQGGCSHNFQDDQNAC